MKIILTIKWLFETIALQFLALSVGWLLLMYFLNSGR
jgi:hypothetical protein